MNKYYNYHKHDHKGNPFSLDVIVKLEDFCQRATELGHDAIFTTCHGFQGDIFEATTLAHQYNLKLIVGAELYFVEDRKEKDRSNRHIIIIALNDDGIRDLNRIVSQSFIDGFYYKPRIDEELLFSINPDNVVITTACVAGVWNNEKLISLMKNYFKDHLFLEVQNHNENTQKEVNKKILELSEKYDIKIIHANDSHYILPEDATYREKFLKAKGINYPEELNFVLDYPDYDTIVKRYKEQNVLNEEQIYEALNNTLIFENVDCSNFINDDIKLPSISKNPNEDLKKILNQSWDLNKKIIPVEKRKEYLNSIRYEMDIIEKTNMANYFLIDYYISKIAKEKYGGVLTKTGRGCFTGYSLIHTLKGIKYLKDVKIGDYVITEDGKFNKVLNTFNYNIDEEMIKIEHLYGLDNYSPVCTTDHKILVLRDNKRKWIEAKNLNTKDYVCVPKVKFNNKKGKIIDLNEYNIFKYKADDKYIYEENNKKISRYITIDENFNQFIGLMYGDGINDDDICLMIDKRNYKNNINKEIFYDFVKKIGLCINEKDTKNENVKKLYFNSKTFSNFIKEKIFNSSKEKEFNSEWFYQSKRMVKNILLGLLNSNHNKKNFGDNNIILENVSLSILNAYKLMCLYTEKGICSLNIKSKNKYDLKMVKDKIIEDKKYYYLPIKEIKRLDKKPLKVYDLEIENNHSYLINNMIVHNSAPSFYITNLLHLTNIDRLASPIKLFPTRFMSIERILGARSLPDIDLNTADAEPFIKASQDLLGEDNCAWMISWKPLQESSAFRLYCKSLDLDFEEVNKVGKDLDKYREDEKWKQIIEDSKPFIGVIEGISESPCFVEGAKIKTSNGYKNIENLNTSDLVLTHNNQYRQVIRTMSHEVDSVIELKNMGSLPIKTTFNHPFYIRKHIGRKYFLENNKYKSIRKFTNPYWEQASNLTKGDYIGMPVNFKSIIPQWENLDLSDENIWWIIGRYIGDGWLRLVKKGKNHGQSYHTLICCNKNDNEQQEIEERISKCFNYTKTEENTTYRYDISLKSLYSYLEKFGKEAKEKHLIEDVYDLPVYLLKAFLEGYQSADGYSPKNRNGIFYTSISYDLILGLQNCIHKCYKVPTTITYRKKENIKHSVLSDGRKIVAKNDVYTLSFRLNGNKYNGFFEDNYMWLPFRYKKEIIENNIVYNISVKDDESYTVNNIAVHNCSMVLYDKDVRSEIGMIKTPNGKICCLLDGYNCDKYKYLKNDYLTVTVWAIVRDVCKLVGIEIPSINELDNLLDKQTFDIYKNGLTCTINQADSDYATNLVTKYKPQNLAEMSSFVAIIRPGCASLLDDFISRKPYTTGVSALDNILEDSGHRLIYQESIMKYLIWLGISEPQSYDIIKKIAKKKFKEQELKELKTQLLQGWEKQVGSEEGFEETWKVVEDAAKYSFNACVSGDTIIKQPNSSKDKNLTVKEMFNIHNKKSTIYGNAFSMYNDKKIHENKIINIYYSGKADIYRVTTENGSYIDCTLNHKFPTDNGKIRLDNLNIGDELYVLDKEIKSSKDLLVKKDKIISIKFLRNDDVYDIEMASPAHNFISITGLITSNSHSLSYAYDSLYGAYLKSHYPLEYYTVALNYYQNDIDRTMKLTKELSYFGITLNNARFRYSKDDYFMDKKSKKIYKGTSSIKFLNKDCSNYLYTLKDKHYNNFIDFLIEIENAKDDEGKSYINSKQMGILIQLQYFEEFGKNKKLLEIYKYFKDIYGRKMLAKSKLADIGIKESDIAECYEKETEKQYINIKPYKILLNIMERIPNENIPIKEQISFEEEIMGYISATYDVDKKYCYILDVDTKYSPKVTLYSLGTGKEVICKINKFIYKDQPIKKGQIIQCGRFFQKERQIKTENGWEKTNVMDWWLSSYNIVEKLEI